MRKHIATGTMGSAWGNVITGIIYVYFGNAIGLTRLQWGILGGISSWVVVMQPLGTMLADRVGSRRLVWFWTALSDRVLRMVGIVGAFLLWRSGSTAGYLFFMTAVCVGTLLGNLSPGAWYGWLSTIIPREVQGTFWGRRDSWISLIVILVTLPSGFVMDLVPREGKLATAVLILVAVSILGCLDILIHVTLPEPPMRAAPAGGSFAGMLKPLKDRGFRPWLVFTACWNFSLMLGGGLSNLYFMENLGFRNDLFGGMIASTIVGLVGTLFAARRVGRMVDRFGVKRMLAASHLLWSFVPAIWLFATPGASALFWVGLGSVVGGVFSVAAANASVKLSTRFPSPEDSGMYMSIFSMIGSLAAGLGTLAAGLFLNAAGAWSVTILGLVVSAFPVLFVVSTLGRFATLFTLLPRVRETSGAREERTFLLPLFFEGLPVIERFRRQSPKR